MASVLGMPVGAGFQPQNLDAPVPATVKGAKAGPPRPTSRKKLRKAKAPRAKSLKGRR